MASPGVYRLLLLLAALLFSTGGTAIKATTLSSWQVASFRSCIAAIVLFIVMPSWRRWWHPRALLVGCAYAATMVLYCVGNKLTTAANTIFLQSTAPLYVLLLGPLLLKERLRLGDLIFAGTLAVGLALFFVGIDAPQETAPAPLQGNIVSAFGGIAWAFTILGLRWLGRHRDATTTAAAGDMAGAAVVAGNVLAGLIILPLALPVTGAVVIDWAIAAYLGIFQVGLAYICMTRGLRQVSAIEASLLLLADPVLNALLAWWIHGERPGTWSLAGCIVILAATLTRILKRS